MASSSTTSTRSWYDPSRLCYILFANWPSYSRPFNRPSWSGGRRSCAGCATCDVPSANSSASAASHWSAQPWSACARSGPAPRRTPCRADAKLPNRRQCAVPALPHCFAFTPAAHQLYPTRRRGADVLRGFALRRRAFHQHRADERPAAPVHQLERALGGSAPRHQHQWRRRRRRRPQRQQRRPTSERKEEESRPSSGQDFIIGADRWQQRQRRQRQRDEGRRRRQARVLVRPQALSAQRHTQRVARAARREGRRPRPPPPPGGGCPPALPRLRRRSFAWYNITSPSPPFGPPSIFVVHSHLTPFLVLGLQ